MPPTPSSATQCRVGSIANGAPKIGSIVEITLSTPGDFVPSCEVYNATFSGARILGVSLDDTFAVGDPCRVCAVPGQVVLVKASAGSYTVGGLLRAIAVGQVEQSYIGLSGVQMLRNAACIGVSLFAGSASAGDLIPCLLDRGEGLVVANDGTGNQTAQVDFPIASSAQLEASAALAIPGWTAMTLTNGYTNIGSPYSASCYCKTPTGNVRMKVGVANGTNGAVFATLPAGWRSLGRILIPAYIDTGGVAATNWVRMDSDGTLRCLVAGGASGIGFEYEFKAEQ